MSFPKSNKRIALITTWYPPVSGVAVGRMSAFANYLSQDYEIEVFCLGKTKDAISKSETLKVHYFPSNKLFEKLKSNQVDSKIIHNSKTVLRILLKKVLKNPLNKWRKSVFNDLKKQHDSNPFYLIISSYSPEESHLVAIDFCKDYPSVPWIADMRDEMSTNPYIDSLTRERLKNIESLVNKYARAIISVSKPILDEFRIICKDVLIFDEIRNGFDHSIKFNQDKRSTSQVIRFGYFGSFYGLRKPDNFFSVLVQLQIERPEMLFEVHIYGAHNNYFIPTSLKDLVFKHEGLSYLNAIKEMNKMDVNVLIHPRSVHKGVFSGKIFDYISVKKPVFALVDKDDVASELIQELKCGYVSEFDDIEEIKEKTYEIFNDFNLSILKTASDDAVLALHRKNSVQKLSVMIQNLISK